MNIEILQKESVKDETDSRCDNLTKLIVTLEKNVQAGSAHIKSFKDPQMLIDSLKEFNEVIGAEEFKAQVTCQIEHVVANEIRKRSSKVVDEPEYNNIVIYGVPGTGKSMMSMIIAKIFYALGLINGSKSLNDNDVKPSDEIKSGDDTKPKEQKEKKLRYGNFLSFMLQNIFIIIMLGSIFLFAVKFFPEKYYYPGIAILLIIFFLLVFGLYYMNNTIEEDPFHINLNDMTRPKKKRSKLDISTDYMTKATRDSFVAKYLGQSADKTRAFLEENFGKVIFVDEAYGLIQGHDDMYGIEVCNEIVQFMSEHKKDIIFIFAGYEDQLNDTIFKFQDGFKRRFVYHWTVPNYTPLELYKIFKLKVDKSGWDMDNEEEIKKIIIDNYDHFKAFGGDMENVLKFAKFQHSKDLLHGEVSGLTTFSKEHIQRSIETFKKNKTNTEPKASLIDELRKFQTR